jgi:tyrosine-protein kinase Etk/Wzc
MSKNPDQLPGLEIEQRNFNVKRFLFGYFKYWYLFLISLVIALFIARYYNWYATPIYRSSCRIILEDQNAGGENILKELNDYKRNRNIENEMQILKSVSLISKTVKQLELEETYILQGKIKSTELYKKCPFIIKADTLTETAYFSELAITILNQDKFTLSYHPRNDKEKVSNQEYNFNKKITNELGVFTVNKRKEFDSNLFNDPNYDKKNFKVFFNPIENIANYYAANLTIEVVANGSSILQLSTTDVVPEQCADFLNKLTEVYIQNSIEQKNLLASNSLKFIDSQIKQISEELKQIEDNMLDFKSNKGIIDVDAESKLFLEQVKGFDEKISENSVQLSFIDYLEKYIKENKKVNDITPSSLGIADPLLIKLIANLSELENERDKRNYDSKPSNPLVEALDQQIKKVKGSILETLNSIRQNYNLMQKEANQQLGKIESKIRSMPKTEIELISIKRQFTIKEGLYVYLLQKRSETAILLASTVSDNRIIDKAEPSYNPIKPVKSKTNAIAIVLGLLLPALIISIRNLLNDKVADKEVLEGNTKIPLMGIIGLNENNFSLFSEQKPKAIFLESLRTIRTNINYFIGENKSKKKQNVILVTSSIGGEGKTFCAYNLSGIFALSEKRTVLVCLDMRKPKIVEGVKLKHDRGMSNYLAGISTIEEVIQHADALPHLDIIFSGPVPPNPSELLFKEKMDELFEYLSKEYDYVIVDTPPIGLVTDGIVLSKYSDVNIYVVRQNITRKQHLQFINKLYEEGKIKNLGIVFNAVKDSSSGYGYGYGYGYGGYGYGEEHEDKKKNKLQRIFSKKTSA